MDNNIEKSKINTDKRHIVELVVSLIELFHLPYFELNLDSDDIMGLAFLVHQKLAYTLATKSIFNGSLIKIIKETIDDISKDLNNSQNQQYDMTEKYREEVKKIANSLSNFSNIEYYLLRFGPNPEIYITEDQMKLFIGKYTFYDSKEEKKKYSPEKLKELLKLLKINRLEDIEKRGYSPEELQEIIQLLKGDATVEEKHVEDKETEQFVVKIKELIARLRQPLNVDTTVWLTHNMRNRNLVDSEITDIETIISAELSIILPTLEEGDTKRGTLVELIETAIEDGEITQLEENESKRLQSSSSEIVLDARRKINSIVTGNGSVLEQIESEKIKHVIPACYFEISSKNLKLVIPGIGEVYNLRHPEKVITGHYPLRSQADFENRIKSRKIGSVTEIRNLDEKN